MKDTSTAETTSAPAKGDLESVRVWDPLLRLFHWSLTICVVAAFGLGHFGPDIMTLHFWFGYAVLGLLAFRVVWGLIGPVHARFASFDYGPWAILKYSFTLFSRKPSYWPGHNPLGGVFVFILLAVLAVQAVSGLFVDPDDFVNVGPLAKYATSEVKSLAIRTHVLVGWVVLGLVVLHVAAILFYAHWKGENLVRPMMTGMKTVRRKR